MEPNNNKFGLIELYRIYQDRINQLEIWRHLVVVFSYSMFVILISKISEGNATSSTMSILDLLTNAFNYTFFLLISFITCIFSAWSQARVFKLAICLHYIETDNKFPMVENLDKPYYFPDYFRGLKYLISTSIANYIQYCFVMLVLLFSDKNLFVSMFSLIVITLQYCLSYLIIQQNYKDYCEIENSLRS